MTAPGDRIKHPPAPEYDKTIVTTHCGKVMTYGQSVDHGMHCARCIGHLRGVA